MGLISQIVILHLVLLTFSTSAENSVEFRAELKHIDAGKGHARAACLQRAADRTRSRSASLVGRFGPAAVHPSDGEFVFDLAIGTPPLNITGILDTGSNLLWTQCRPLIKSIPQPAPLFDPFRSSSFSSLPCHHPTCRALVEEDHDAACIPGGCFFHYHYGDGTDAIGYMGTETFRFGSGAKETSIHRIAFGCGLYNAGSLNNASAVVGFGQQRLSLISQISAGAFSYCFPNYFEDDNAHGVLLVGSAAKMTGHGVRSMPLIPLTPGMLTVYYVSLKGITVGERRLSIPAEAFQVRKDGSGGFIVDSGTAALTLVTPAYKVFVEAFRSGIKWPAMKNSSSLTSFELCYEGKVPVAVPALVLHFEGADWELQRGNYLVEGDGLSCLVVQESPADSVSVLGNIQTMNTLVHYDLTRMALSFVPAKCDQL